MSHINNLTVYYVPVAAHYLVCANLFLCFFDRSHFCACYRVFNQSLPSVKIFAVEYFHQAVARNRIQVLVHLFAFSENKSRLCYCLSGACAGVILVCQGNFQHCFCGFNLHGGVVKPFCSEHKPLKSSRAGYFFQYLLSLFVGLRQIHGVSKHNHAVFRSIFRTVGFFNETVQQRGRGKLGIILCHLHKFHVAGILCRNCQRQSGEGSNDKCFLHVFCMGIIKVF